jgi:hypothetical protein
VVGVGLFCNERGLPLGSFFFVEKEKYKGDLLFIRVVKESIQI